FIFLSSPPFFFCLRPCSPSRPLFPYTTLFRSPQSAWIVLTMFFMALFLGFAKRRGEMTNLVAKTAGGHRPVLVSYSIPFVISPRSEEHTSELQSRVDLVCRLLLEKKHKRTTPV